MAALIGKVLTNPEAWRLEEHLLQALADWGHERDYTITHKRDLPAGKSGSRMAVAGIKEGSKKSRHVIVKLVPPDVAIREAQSIARAKSDSPPEFFAKHIVEVTENTPPPQEGRWWVQEQKIAGVNLMEIETLGRFVHNGDFADMCGKIVREVVNGWQGENGEEIEETPEGFLRDYFASSPSPRREEGLREFAEAARLSFDEPADMVTIPGRSGPLPNPFMLLAGRDTSGVFAQKITFYLANGHGDFHCGNILIPVRDHHPVAGEFRIIDYGRFSRLTPVARDPAKLILDIAGTWLDNIPPRSPVWRRLAELVAWPAGHPESSAISGYLKVAQAVHTAAAGYYTDGTLQDWQPQHLVVHLGSALRFVADSTLPMETRWWYFEVAALAARGIAGPSSLTSAEAFTALNGAERTSDVQRYFPPVSTPEPPITGVLAEVARGVGGQWPGLANFVETPDDVRRTFSPGRESFGLMRWLNQTGKIVHLRNSLIHIERDDLVKLLDADF